MEAFKMPKVSLGKQILGSVIALIVGLLFPVFLCIELAMLTPVILISNVLVPVFYVCCGPFAAVMLLVSQILSTGFLLGNTVTIMILLASVIPSIIIIRGLAQRRHFFVQMRNGLLAHLIGLVAAVFVAYISFGSGMIQKFIDSIRQQVMAIPDEWLMPLVQSVNDMAASLAGESLPKDMLMTVDTYRSLFSGTLMDMMQEMYVQYLPGSLLMGAALTGMISVLWGNWRMARKGLATTESFIGMSQWEMPAQLSLGAFFIWIVGFVIVSSGAFGADNTAYVAIYMLVQLIFYVQAVCGLDRRFKARCMGLRGRRILIFLVLIGAMIIPLINSIMFIYGGGSLFINLVRKLKDATKKKMDENDHDNM